MPDANNPEDYDLQPRARLISNPEAGETGDQRLAGRFEDLPSSGHRDYLRLLRKYSLMAVALVLAGVAAGVASVVFSTPVYNARAMLEVQGINEALLKDSFELSTSYDSNQLNIQTQIKLLQDGPFLRRVYERLQTEAVPSPPVQSDFFSRLRSRVHNQVQDPDAVRKQELRIAFASFEARAVNGTRLIEISCDSTNPMVASHFINAMSSDFLEETMRARSENSRRASAWLTAQIEETKIKLREAEERLQSFVQRSGNLFVGPDMTLDDSKLKQLQAELATIQADRIAKQARYEMVSKASPETLPEALDDADVRGLKTQIAELRGQKASLESTMTPEHPKVKKIDAQLAALEASLQKEIDSIVARLQNEYEAARSRESLLASAYADQSQRVSAAAGKSAEHDSLTRDVDTLRKMYQALQVQADQTGISGSVPANPIRLVEATSPPTEPYKPVPALNIGFGLITGVFLTFCIALLREKLDRSVRNPDTSQRLFNVPQLGVIPSAKLLQHGGLRVRFRRNGTEPRLNGTSAEGRKSTPQAIAVWNGGRSFMAESFRTTLASLMTESRKDKQPAMILVTSPGPGEGKTTIAVNLAMALSETGRKVLLVDADFRRPRLHQIFGIPNIQGLSNLLAGQAPFTEQSVGEVTVDSGMPGLTLLVNGPQPGDISRALYSPHLRALLESLRARFDVVVLDTPPILHLADARLIAPFTDGVILVLRSGATDQASALEACQRIQEDGLTLLGTVLNDWNPGKSHLTRHHYYDYSRQEK